MSDEEIRSQLRSRLNLAGRDFGVSFQVLNDSRVDGEWTQFFVEVDENGKRPAAAQILADVESDLSRESGREIILLRVKHAHAA